MKDEIHLYLDEAAMVYRNDELRYTPILVTYDACEREMRKDGGELHTTQTHFLSWRYGRRLFCHLWNDKTMEPETHEITIGECDGTNREIREAHIIEKMLIAGEFDWYR